MKKSHTIKKILIANRGEIAVRVIRTARELGIKTVAIYTSAERGLPHVTEAHESYLLGDGPLKETYLNQERIIEIAKQFSADAIHPGYGFLSENTYFAKKVEEAGIIFVGPTAKVIHLMGDKKQSKQTLEAIGVPMIPGYHGENQDPQFLLQKAREIKWPVLIKASAGGGGKGMRVVNNEKEFISSLETAQREALKAFGDDRVLLEKYLLSPHHIEVQIVGDSHGNVVHLFERECSIQRRHQKIVEETPSPTLDPTLRQQICETAVKIGRHLGYTNAGTVEFILDEAGDFFFLEMNTRLQVEHPVTEMITGQDLVAWQIKVAQGEKLPLKQEQIVAKGHAIEVRICSEDPDADFLPTAGKITQMGRPTHKDVRLDTGYRDGEYINPDFDPMLAKLIAWGVDRETARKRLYQALNEVVFLGPKTNRSYLQRILAHPQFAQGKTATDFVVIHKSELGPPVLEPLALATVVAASLAQEFGRHQRHGQILGEWGHFRNV